MRLDILTSTLHHTVGDLAQFLEAAEMPEQWSFLDGGTTLEICFELLDNCRQHEEWLSLEKRYTELNCCIFCPDSDDYDLALEVA
jgi:hypothetical protein